MSQPTSGPAAPNPSQEELQKLDEDLMKLRARADAVKSSLDNLRQQQAASGVGLRQDIAASASRLDSYLQAVDRAIQSGNAQSARKNMEHVEEELGKLETFFGR
jgi:chromosome segregation ATPase